jgi:hypothetical protein
MIQIKRNNKVFFTLEDFGEGSKLSYQLMDHHYIILKFTTATPVYFEIGDSVEIPDFGYFELTSSYFPKHNDSDGYDYEMQMDAYYMSWKNKICKYRPQHGANETSFNLTTTVGVHMNVILGNLKALGLTYNGKDFSVDYTTYNNKAFDVQKRFLIEYGSISILDALNAICSEDALNCEWWIDGSIIYLGYCEMEGQTTFEQDVNVLSMSYSESKSTYITRLYAFGSDRNIPKGYFTGADADVTTDGVATDYLMLPNKEVDSDGFYAKDGYLENVNVVKNDKQAIEGVVMFEEEYPKVESVVSSIKTYDSTVDNEDGTKTTQTFWQVTATDSFATNFEAIWIKSNLTLGIKFTSGALMGMEFDVSFKVIDKVNYFEIVANDTYGRTLPDGVMCPKVGDKFFLFNWDATKITDTDLIPTAQLSLFDRAKQYYQKTMISNSNFTCTMDGDKFYNNGTYDYHPLGEQVKLINNMFAQVDADGKHYRNSRIIGMEIPLDIPYDHPQYTVGEKAATSRLGKLEDKVDSITVNGTQIGGIGSGNGSGGVYVIGMNDLTPPTDSNVLSARKSINSFISKLNDDTANGKITFIKGLIAKGLADLMMGARFGNNAMITELGEAIFSAIKSLDYDNAAEQGFSVEKEKNGKYHAFFTNLTIWGKARFHELEVRKLSYSGGNIYLSGAGSKLIKVVPVKQSVSAGGATSWVETTEDDAECVGWKCYLLADDGTTATMNDWQEGDQARCQTMGEIVSGGTYQNASNKSYWRTIPDGGVSTQNEKIYGTKTETYLDEDGNEQTKEVQVELYDGQAFAWIVVGKHCDDIDGYDDEFSVGYNGSNPAPLETRDIPAEGDTIVLDGNRHRDGNNQEYDKTDRQNVIILETTGEYAPRIACYANITEYKHTITKSVNGSDKEVSLSVFETSPKGGTKINSSRFEWISDDGSTINIINYRGDWVSNNTYHKNDQVNHNNAVWVCVANSGVDVSEEPSDSSKQWKKVLSGGKGEKGDDAVSYSVSLMKELRTIAGHSNQSAVTVSFRKQEGSKSTVSGNIATFGDSASVKCYVDGERSDNMTDWINSGNDYFGYLNYEDAWAGKSVITVVMYIGDNIVASANFSLGQSGEGVVMAYKNAPSQPSKPTVEDLSQLSDGWSRTPQKGGSYNKVSNISYGNYSVDNTTSGYSTSEWSEVSDSGETWRKSPAGLSDSYGWAIMKVSFTTNVDNLDVNVIIKAYSEANFDFVQVHELDTETTGSNDLRKKGIAYISGKGIETSYSYHIATAGRHFFYVSYCKDSSSNSNGDYGLFRFDLSDNLVSMPSTVWMSQAILKEGKAVLPWSTPVQITGDDVYRVVVSPSVLIFDTDDNGRVTSFSGKTATIRVYQGDKDVSSQFSKYDRLPSNYYNCNGSLKDLNTSPLEIQVTEIETQVVTDTAGNKSTISKTNGFLEFILTNDSATVTAHVDVQVNVAKFTGQMVNTNKRFSNTLQEVSTRVDDKVGSSELTQFKAEITQTAREISLSVSEKSIARRNLLVGSAFLREDNHVEITDGVRIEMNSGYQGTNCIHSIDETDGTPHYRGAFWDGSQGGKSIKITKGKKYVISCWYYTNDTNGHLSLEALYTDKQTNAERKGAPKYLSAGSLVPKPNQWQLFTTVIDTTDAEYDYIAFNFFEYSNDKVGRIDAYICRPMVEEGDTYGGWTLSQNDYDIIGANLIDNSRTLDVGGNVLEVKGQKDLVGDAYELTYIGSDDYNTFYRIKGSTFKLGVDYTISFEVRGDAKYMGVYAYYPITNTKFTFYAEPQNGAMTEVTDGGKVDNYVALIQVKELSKQQRVWSHFRFKGRLPEHIYFQFPKNAQQTGVTSWSVTITKPKIEVGAVVTEYTERKSDLVDKASLKAAGIEITSDQVILYGNKVQVKNPKANPSEGYDEAAMFQNGKLNAQFINAGDIVAEGIKTQDLEAQNLNVTGNSRLGIFRIKTSGADERDQYTIAGDMITYSGDYKFPDGTTTITSDDGLAYLMYKPLFIRQGAPDAGKYMRLGNCYTEWDDSGFGFDHSYLFNGASARYVCGGVESECKKYVLPTDLTYNTNYFPVSYIYSIKSSPNDPAFAINVQKAKNTTGERTAIQTNGAIRGVLAPNSMSISWDGQTIPNGIGVVICTNGSEMTLTLPANPLEGQTLIIIQGSDKRVYIVPSGDEVIYCGGQTRDKNNKFFSGMIGQFNIFVFIRGNWQLQWMNYRL